MANVLTLAPLQQAEALEVRQVTEWHEAFSGFETANQYRVSSPHGEIFHVAEESEGFLAVLSRLFLQASRPFTLHISDGTQIVATATRPWRFYFHEIEVEVGGRRLGSVRRRFSILRRRFDVLDAEGRAVLELVGPLLKPWTFEAKRDGADAGVITKQWSGLGKELLTDADDFGVRFAMDLPDDHKMLLLCAVFLIDFLYFEKKSSRS
ncbi:MAG TPA: phospholipid scramblase-related protein [Sandaracinaceae bacterium LLY-WYZ-13_1]|nr:phospholipid scramblase-related protein [Sandaracinaceae bacterium LLY-WYZ-13_1]